MLFGGGGAELTGRDAESATVALAAAMKANRKRRAEEVKRDPSLKQKRKPKGKTSIYADVQAEEDGQGGESDDDGNEGLAASDDDDSDDEAKEGDAGFVSGSPTKRRRREDAGRDKFRRRMERKQAEKEEAKMRQITDRFKRMAGKQDAEVAVDADDNEGDGAAEDEEAAAAARSRKAREAHLKSLQITDPAGYDAFNAICKQADRDEEKRVAQEDERRKKAVRIAQAALAKAATQAIDERNAAQVAHEFKLLERTMIAENLVVALPVVAAAASAAAAAAAPVQTAAQMQKEAAGANSPPPSPGSPTNADFDDIDAAAAAMSDS